MSEDDHVVSINCDLSLEDVVAVARYYALVDIPEKIGDRLSDTSQYLLDYVDETLAWLHEIASKLTPEQKKEPAFELEMKRRMMYGTTTGFGELKTKYIKGGNIEDLKAKAKKLQENIVLSHASGVGAEFDAETTRAIMLLRANTLASGFCGVRPVIVEQLRDFLIAKIYPCIPEQGSVGSSGDLAPLSHLALGLIGRGPVRDENHVRFDNLATLQREHPELGSIKSTLPLSYKEGLALVNGLTVMTGIGVLAHADAENLAMWADVIGAVTLESIIGSSRAFDLIVFKQYGHPGATKSAGVIRDMITGSELINRSSDVHDPYSVRCMPQVHGAVRDAIGYVRTTLKHQLNSVDDDPIIFTKQDMDDLVPFDNKQAPEGSDVKDWKKRRHFEQGNFHGEPIAIAMDLLAIAVAELGSISERRTQMLLDKHHNRQLPPCLITNPDGINSGYMIAQYTAAALVSENKGLCHPASVDSIPTSANSEDHVSMGTIAARKARKVIENVRNILSIELLCATEALSYRLTEGRTWVDEDEEKEENRKKPKVKGECGHKTKLVYNKVRGRDGISIPNDQQGVFDLPTPNGDTFLLDGKDVILYKLIDQAREKFLSKQCSEMFGWIKESLNGAPEGPR